MDKCECCDPGCPHHLNRECEQKAVEALERIDMMAAGSILMCAGCAVDACESGLFHVLDDED